MDLAVRQTAIDYIHLIVAKAAEDGEALWLKKAAHELLSRFPDSQMKPAEILDLLMRRAIENHVPVDGSDYIPLGAGVRDTAAASDGDDRSG